MSLREPLWFCHECNAEMRPLMMPHPVCTECQSDFVEKIEDPSDDPREYMQGHGDYDEDIPHGFETFLFGLQQFLDRGIMEQGPSSPRTAPRNGNLSNPFSVQIRTGGSGPRQTSGPDRPPTMSEFLGSPNRSTAGGTVTGPVMARYLMSLIQGQRPRDDFSGHMGFGDPAMTGRMGDYVFNQEALDQIITQLMNESNPHRPVPAPEDLVSKLPRHILAAKSPILEKECAICKEQFELNTEDPAEQIVITLPCEHPFHEPCILPWLKSSSTCPVCRYALVPQPEHNPPTPTSDLNSRRNRPASPSSSRNGSRQGRDFGIFQSLFGGFGSGGRPSSSTHTRSSSDPTTRSRSNRDDHFPGSWDDLD